ncbi:MAG: hypothetical protein WCQ21_36625 [Verrucomicrobiota bacterium]
MFTLLIHIVLQAAAGLPQIPTEIAAHVISYQAIRYRVPIHFVEEELSAPWQLPTCRTTSLWKICTGRCPRWWWVFRPSSCRNTWVGILVAGDVSG